MKLTAYQIHFNERSKANCFPESDWWKHYDNSDKLTEYFENSVIVDLISKGDHVGSDYFGVFSHDVAGHIHFAEMLDGRKLRFSPDALRDIVMAYPGVDVFSFQKRRKNQNIVLQAENYHPGFVGYMTDILRNTGFMDSVPSQLDHIILFNHFVAKSDIYEQYVKELLMPAMDVMKYMAGLWEDSGYIKHHVHGKIMPDNWQDHFQKSFGVPYYPYHAFLCERLPSIFCQKHKLNVKQIF